jgi:hypothetical protein
MIALSLLEDNMDIGENVTKPKPNKIYPGEGLLLYCCWFRIVADEIESTLLVSQNALN